MAPMKSVPTWLAWLWREGIGFRLAVLVSLILLPFIALSVLVYQQHYQLRMSAALRTETEVAQGLSVAFAAYLQGIHKQNLAVGHAILILSPADREHISELLMTSVGHSISVRNINWVSRDGIVQATSAPGSEGVPLGDTPAFRALAAGSDLALGDLTEIAALSHKPSFTLATAIRDYRRRLRGAIVAEIAPATLGRAIVGERELSDVTVSLFDSQGTPVYRSGAGRFWRPPAPLRSRTLASRSPQAAITSGMPQEGRAEYVTALAAVPGTAWLAGAASSTRVAFAELRRGLVVELSLRAAAFVLAFLLAYLLGRNIVAPLRRLENDARLMGEGKTVPLSDPFAPREVDSLRGTMLAMTADLTRRADELRESEELFRTVFENVYDGILIHDGDGRILQVNQRWLTIFRMGRDQVDGLTIADISVAPPPDRELKELWRQILAGETRLFEWRSMRPKDRSELDAEVFICPIRLGGVPLIMACMRDITERKRVTAELQRYRNELETRVQERTEELARAVDEIKRETSQRVAAVEELRRKEQLLIQQSRLAAMGDMMGNIAHQWRQPLNLLALLVQELKISYQKGNFTEELLMEGVAKAMTVIRHMSQTIDDFRNLLSPDKAKLRFSGKEVVEKVLSMLRLQAEVRVEAEAECEMEGSRNEYSQVIINIIANARDVFRDRKIGSPVIIIRLFREGGRSVVTIGDNGGGIDEEIIDRIFDPYFTTKGPDRGTGLGLFMSKTIIEKSMHGRLSVRNAGEGAEFRIEVPGAATI